MSIEELTSTLTLNEKNAALRAAVERRLYGQRDDDEHPVLAEDHEADDEPDPIRGGMSAEEVIERFAPHPSSRRFLELLDEMAELHRSKSRDYGSEEDPLANIRHGADYVSIEAWRGCMVRIADKVQRLRTYCKTGRLVHEGVRDTLLDLAAYSLLAIVLFEEGHG
jgi:hypothetical protein